MNKPSEISSNGNGRNVDRAADGCDQSDQSSNNTSDSDLVKKTENYQTNPFQIPDFVLCINRLCRFTAGQPRKTNPFSSLLAPKPPRRRLRVPPFLKIYLTENRKNVSFGRSSAANCPSRHSIDRFVNQEL